MLWNQQSYCLPIGLLLFLRTLQAVYIPPDVEILDGYEFDESPEYYQSEPSYLEAKSLVEGFIKSIRNKRSTLSHDEAKAAQGGEIKTEQNVNSAAIKVHETNREEIKQQKDKQLNQEQLPKPEKQVTNPAEIYFSNRRSYRNDPYTSASSYSRSLGNDGDDDASRRGETTDDGYRGRQARVNFVTQSKKDGDRDNDDDIKDYSQPILTNVFAHKSRYDPKYPPYSYDIFPSKSYDPYLRRYDRFDEQQNRFDGYEDHYVHRRYYDPYDSYSPRMPQFPDPFYLFPDRRYDVPEPRTFASHLPRYNNDLYERPQPQSQFPAYNPNRNHRRIVYYAHLPEIVRGSKTIDYNRNGDGSRYDGLLTSSSLTGSRSSEVYKTAGALKLPPKNGVDASALAAQEYVKREKKNQNGTRQ